MHSFQCLNIKKYLQTSNISRILVGHNIVDHSDAVGALPVSAAPTQGWGKYTNPEYEYEYFA